MGTPLRVLLLAVSIGLLLSACGPSPGGTLAKSSLARTSDPGLTKEAVVLFTRSNNDFAFDLYQSLRQGSGNFVYSPYSISAALAMTYAGARQETESQMASVLHFDLPQDQLHASFNQLDLTLTGTALQSAKDGQPFDLRIANAIWTDKTLNLLDEYLDTIAHNYGAGIHLADFLKAYEPARREINNWVSDQTEKRIEDLIPQGAVDESTRMVLVNAIYFKGDWLDQFDPTDTQQESFNLLSGSQVSVDMMRQHLTGTLYAAGQDYQAVELPYQGGTVAMDIIIPDDGHFQEFENDLGPARLEEILDAMQPVSLQLALPKFKFTSDFGLHEQLSAMGMPDAFDPDRADFSGMTGGPDLCISKVLHKAFVAVDEEGTEAAAATAVIMMPTSAMLPDLSVVVDRPFVFVIRELGTRQILFLGRVLDPTL